MDENQFHLQLTACCPLQYELYAKPCPEVRDCDDNINSMKSYHEEAHPASSITNLEHHSMYASRSCHQSPSDQPTASLHYYSKPCNHNLLYDQHYPKVENKYETGSQVHARTTSRPCGENIIIQPILDKSTFTIRATHGIACTCKMGSVANENAILGWETCLSGSEEGRERREGKGGCEGKN